MRRAIALGEEESARQSRIYILEREEQKKGKGQTEATHAGLRMLILAEGLSWRWEKEEAMAGTITPGKNDSVADTMVLSWSVCFGLFLSVFCLPLSLSLFFFFLALFFLVSRFH